MFHNELSNFAPRIGLSPQTRTALELMLQQESAGRFDARPVRKIVGADGSERYQRISSAFSGMQIIDDTWNALNEKYGNQIRVQGVSEAEQRQHPVAQARASALLARDDLRIMSRRMPERDLATNPLTAGEQYMAHFLGGSNAAEVLTANPGTPLRNLVSDGVIDNHKRVRFNGKPFADFTAGDLRNWAQHKMTQHIGTVATIAVDAIAGRSGPLTPSEGIDVLMSYVQDAGAPPNIPRHLTHQTAQTRPPNNTPSAQR